MLHVTEDSKMPEAKTKLIDGESFTISQPYDEGHVCNAAEAKTLNQVRSENIGNNFREKVKKAKEDGTLSAVAEEIAKYDAEYIFTVSNGGTKISRDPVEREAFAIAKEQLANHLAKTGRKLRVAPEGRTKEDWAEAVASEVERIAGLPEVVAEAKKRVKSKERFSLDIGGEDSALAA
jgi:hypothetical protein